VAFWQAAHLIVGFVPRIFLQLTGVPSFGFAVCFVEGGLATFSQAGGSIKSASSRS
jgi:hypothetical protein